MIENVRFYSGKYLKESGNDKIEVCHRSDLEKKNIE